MNAFHAALIACRALWVYVLISLAHSFASFLTFTRLLEFPGGNLLPSTVLGGLSVFLHLMALWLLWFKADAFAVWVSSAEPVQFEPKSTPHAYAHVAFAALGALLIGMALPGLWSIFWTFFTERDGEIEKRLLTYLAPHLLQAVFGIALVLLRARLSVWALSMRPS